LVVELWLKTYFGSHGGRGGKILTALKEKNEFARSSCHQVQINTTEKNDEHYQKYSFLLILQENARS
jgi:hypothetical protein